MTPARFLPLFVVGPALLTLAVQLPAADDHNHEHHAHAKIEFSIHSVQNGDWSNPQVWQPPRVPATGDRVLISRGTQIAYDMKSEQVIRLVQVVGTLRFARDRNTELNVGVLKVQDSDECSESGFACDFEGVNSVGEPQAPRDGVLATLEVGTLDNPIPAEHTARIRLHFLEGFDRQDAPAIVACAARMELHGAPLSRTWVKLGRNVRPGDDTVLLDEPVSGWRVGDEVIVTGSKKHYVNGSLRDQREKADTEERRITSIDGATIHLDRPVEREHYGEGEFRSEVANLSRNVVIESADPDGVRGHTLFHAYSQGGVSYTQFAHLGKEGVLGRYALHFHLLGDTMRGSQVLGAAIVDSHNRWITIHGTEYLVVRDCVGYRSIGHGFFLEDGTEVYNLLDRNLGVQAYRGKRLPNQVLSFDPNEGAAFWWANGRNTLVRNVSCENEEYGFRYDLQKRSNFDPNLAVRMPDGQSRVVDVRTIPIWRFEQNEAHTEGLYGLVVAANGNDQPDTPIDDEGILKSIRAVDWTGPDRQHPHIIRDLTIWEAHYAFRPHSPSMLIDGVRLDRITYGIYRPAFDNHEYRRLHISRAESEPFNRGMDDASAQTGSFSVDGLTIGDLQNGNQGHPFVHMTDLNLGEKAEAHFRQVSWSDEKPRRPVFNRGGSARVDPYLDRGVPYYIHDYYGPGRHAKILSTKATGLLSDGHQYRQEPPLTGDESVVTEVSAQEVSWPKLLDPVDDLPPATVITSVRRSSDKLVVQGIAHDNGTITAVTVNGEPAKFVTSNAGVVDWEISLPMSEDVQLTAIASDEAGNVEQTGHRWFLSASDSK